MRQLQLGMIGDDVWELNRFLVYAVGADGLAIQAKNIFTSGTQTALRTFQERSGLPRTGELDGATVEAWGRYLIRDGEGKSQEAASPAQPSPQPEPQHPAWWWFVQTCEEFAGAAYRFGREVPLIKRPLKWFVEAVLRGGWDCSEAVQVIYHLHGITIVDGAAAQYRATTPVRLGAQRVGDLVFLRNTYKAGISHVGIVLDNNRVLEARSRAAGTVISDLSDWVARGPKFAGIRRHSAMYRALWGGGR